MPSRPPSPAGETPETVPSSVVRPVSGSTRVIVASSRAETSRPPSGSTARPHGDFRFSATVRSTCTEPLAGAADSVAGEAGAVLGGTVRGPWPGKPTPSDEPDEQPAASSRAAATTAGTARRRTIMIPSERRSSGRSSPPQGPSVPGSLRRGQPRDLGQVRRRQPQPGRRRVLRGPPLPLGARQRDHMAALRQHPGQRHLRRGDLRAVPPGDAAQTDDDRLVGRHHLGGEPGMPGAHVVRFKTLARGERAGQEAVAQRHRREETHAPGLAPRQQRPQRLRRPHRQLGLDRGHREHLLHPLQLAQCAVVQARARAAPAARTEGAQAQRPHLPRPHQLRHRAPGLLDGHLGIGAVQLVEVDHIRLQPAQRGVAGPLHIPRAAVGHDVLLAHQQPHLRGDEGLRAPLSEHPAQQQLIGERAVHVRGVQQARPQVQCPVDASQRLVTPPPGPAVRPAHRHAPESDGPHRERPRADRPALHLLWNLP
ncbi:hypothetical protein SGPA1_11576 [Streptomyces misionensis JCM 4497]